MIVDKRYSTAVFLGPTLPISKAKGLLKANYYPPIKLGDLYKLLASGIEVFVIIDGLFDGTTPVWQREILAVIEAGKKVYGASSMGALRGAELAAYGMQGRGQIFQWYADKTIDGDDEVSLFHCNEELSYEKVSEPLVNIRYNLIRACEREIITSEQCDRMISYAKSLYFGSRSFKSLLKHFHDSGIELAPLKHFLETEYIDLKAQDAIGLLQEISRGGLELGTVQKNWFQSTFKNSEMKRFTEFQHRAVITADGLVVPFLDVLSKITAKWPKYSSSLHNAVEHYYLALNFYSKNEVALADIGEYVLKKWLEKHEIADLPSWLPCNGLLMSELYRELSTRHNINRRLTDIADKHAADIDNIYALLKLEKSLPDTISTDNDCQRSDKALKIYALSAWADSCGYHIPLERLKLFNQRCPIELTSYNGAAGLNQLTAEEFTLILNRVFTYIWLMEIEPGHLGYLWDPYAATFQELRINCHLQELIQC
jgi:hypothetical protein